MRKRILIVLGILVAAFVLLSLVAIFVVGIPSFVKVPTGAMARTILPGDHLAISSGVDQVKRGDIIVFRYPVDPEVHYIKRVIALPGETVQVTGSQVLINGNPLPERRLFTPADPDGIPAAEGRVEGNGTYTVYYEEGMDRTEIPGISMFAVEKPYIVPAGNYFVLGDNRDNSADSRYWGPVPQGSIIGKALFIYYSDIPDDTRLYKRLQ